MGNHKNNLRDIRVNLGLKQTDVAQMLGHASPDRISHWEKGVAFPGVLNLFKLSLIYRVPPERLYEDLYKSLAYELQQKNGSKSELRFESKTRLEEGVLDDRVEGDLKGVEDARPLTRSQFDWYI